LASNYIISAKLISTQTQKLKKLQLSFGIILNLSLLCYFKYYNFAIETLTFFGFQYIETKTLILPLAISFITFQQIAFLCDCYFQKTTQFQLKDYLLFITFFPQLIAGPIVYGPNMFPQYKKSNAFRVCRNSLAIGFSIFLLGLFKKVFIADNFKPFADLVFNSPSNVNITLIEAWGGVLCYGFQLYFDFSAYSDMAIGLARMFNIHLPINFNSPYKAKSVIEFWHRWHITLSTFLKDHIYIPLGGNRNGIPRKYSYLFITMVLGGLWHGAGFNFLIWGALHGIYLILNHAWTDSSAKKYAIFCLKSRLYSYLSLIITFVAIMYAWVFFRAESFSAAINIIQGMTGINGIIIPEHYLNWAPIPNKSHWLEFFYIHTGTIPLFQGTLEISALMLGFILIWKLPNTNQFFYNELPAYQDCLYPQKASAIMWHPAKTWAMVFALVSVIVLMMMNNVTEFLYYQF
tara:strand:+ start:33363 stop:34745 length:1383 start_codon:yes stop_codon:yes gene_type:complete